MSFDWGIFAALIALGSAIWSAMTWWKLRQIRKEELMTNIDISLNHSQKKARENKFLWASVILKNIGKMNLMVDQIFIEFIPKNAELKLDFNSIQYANKDLEFSLITLEDKNPMLSFDKENILKIKSESEDWGIYFDPKVPEPGSRAFANPYWLHGLQIASDEEFSEEFTIRYEGTGSLEIKIIVTSFRRERRSISILSKWIDWWNNDQRRYKNNAVREVKKLREIFWSHGRDRKVESFVYFLE